MIYRGLVAMLLLLVAACGGGDLVGNRVKDDVDLNAIATAGPTVEEVLAKGDDATLSKDAPPVPFNHLGRWASTAQACAAQPWVFTTAGASTPDGARCLLTGSETASATSTRLDLRCTSGAIETIERWALNLHPDGGMTASRSEGGDGVPRSSTLKRCS